MIGLVLNMSQFLCPSCNTPHDLFGPSTSIEVAADEMGLPIIGRLPVVPELSWTSDRGVPIILREGMGNEGDSKGVESVIEEMKRLAGFVLGKVQ